MKCWMRRCATANGKAPSAASGKTASSLPLAWSSLRAGIPRGKAIGFLLISKDISDEIRLTEELKATQFYTRSLIESNIDALMTTDPLGIITDVNQQMVARLAICGKS